MSETIIGEIHLPKLEGGKEGELPTEEQFSLEARATVASIMAVALVPALYLIPDVKTNPQKRMLVIAGGVLVVATMFGALLKIDIVFWGALIGALVLYLAAILS